MKKLLYLAVALLTTSMTSCIPKNQYVVAGKVEGGANGDTVVMMYPPDKMDTAIIMDGAFLFTGLADSLISVAQIVAPKQNVYAYCVLEPGKIDAFIAADDKVTGTPLNDALYAVKVKMADCEKRLQSAESLEDRENILKEMTGIARAAIAGSKSDLLSVFYLMQYYHLFKTADLQELISKLPQGVQKDENVVGLTDYLKQKVVAEKAQEATGEGQKFVDLSMKTPEGKSIKLSDIAGKGKYVLVDFWASWCGPCRAEMPKLVELYSQCKGKDFEIVGVSLDYPNGLDAWKQAIADLKITWPQMSDLQGGNSAAASVYGVNAIPHMLLIDKDGTIIVRGLRADEMSAKVKSLLGK